MNKMPCCKQAYDPSAGGGPVQAADGFICPYCGKPFDMPSMELITVRAEIAMHKRRAEEFKRAYEKLLGERSKSNTVLDRLAQDQDALGWEVQDWTDTETANVPPREINLG